MAKETKNVLTREILKKDLKKLQKDQIIITIIFSAVLLIVWLPIILLGLTDIEDALFLWLVLLIFGLFCFALAIFNLISVKQAFRQIENGDFTVITETVSGKVSGERVSRRRYEDVLYFGHYGRYTPSRTVFQLSSVGDEFYLVFLGAHQRVISLAYPCKMYEYKESERPNRI